MVKVISNYIFQLFKFVVSNSTPLGGAPRSQFDDLGDEWRSSSTLDPHALTQVGVLLARSTRLSRRCSWSKFSLDHIVHEVFCTRFRFFIRVNLLCL